MNRKLRLSTAQALAMGFGIVIFAGTVLLMLPVSNRNGETIPFINALFTATSATCVTGLVVYDTYTQFSLFGQLIIMLLIQTGGLGFMTIAILFSMVLGKRIGLKERSFLMEAVNTAQIGGVVRLVKHILIGTFLLEAAGAILLSFRFCPEFGLKQGIWFGMFHSVSAFCNAGFDLMGCISPYVSLMPFQNDVLLNIVMMVLIIMGGIGFAVWDDIYKNKVSVRKYALHTKLILASTAVVILAAAFVLFFTEKDAAFAGMNFYQRVLASLFQAVTPRTAGFNTADTAAMSEGGTLFTMLLMLIGAGPGSTAGGIKISTFAVILLSVSAYARGREEVNAFHRRLEPSQVRRAFSGTAFYLMLAFLGSFLIMTVQSLSLRDVVFESLSALGTVGLSMGITRDLLPVSRLVILFLMFSGRVGSLTVVMAVMRGRHCANLKNSTEKILIG